MLPSSAVDHYQQQQAISVAAAAQVDRLWRANLGADFDLGWNAIAEAVFTVVVAAQGAAAANGVGYVPTVLTEQDIDAQQTAAVNPARFAGGTADGRPLETLLHGAPYVAKTAVGQGLSTQAALVQGGIWLQERVLDVIRDADRQAVQATMATTPTVQGWVRMLNPPSCKFCVMLAGKFYRWNQGFRAHPRCDCRHIPSSESIAGDLTVDPYAYFKSLDGKMQDRVFGKNDAEALRQGADIYRVVNTRSRGLVDDAVKRNPKNRAGWQARRWDTPSKLTVDDVLKAAGGDRAKTVQLLRDNGYITGDQVAGGNLIGNIPNPNAAGALGRGGTRKGATLAYRRAVNSGVRDPLEPATQTAAERRLHRAYLAKQAVDAGRNPFANNTARTPLTPQVRDLVEKQYARQVAQLDDGPEQLRVLARRLHIL